MNEHCRPMTNILDHAAIAQLLENTYCILRETGIGVNSMEALEILDSHGAAVDWEKKIARIPTSLIETVLKTVPAMINLYNEDGEKVITLGGDNISFVPGGYAPLIHDFQSGRPRPALTADLIRFVRVVDGLENIQQNNPALITTDVPKDLCEIYRFFIGLLNTTKPLSGAVTTKNGMQVVKEMLCVVAGGEKEMKNKPRITLSCCPRSPLSWGEGACQGLIDGARFSIPVRIVPAPIAGGTAPVTMWGALLQHTVENLGGLVIHQLINPGAPVYYGSAASILDMRTGSSLYGAIESHMLRAANAQVGRHLGMATYGIFAFSEAKSLDAQAGLESAHGFMLAVLAGVNNIGGAGMLETGLCHSFEKLIIDHDIAQMNCRLAKGILRTQETLACGLIGEVGPGGNFLAADHTLKWTREEFCFHSAAIDRSSNTNAGTDNPKNAYHRAHEVTQRILGDYQPGSLAGEQKKELIRIMSAEGKKHGMDQLPCLDI